MSDENAVPGAAVETAAPTAPGGEGSAPSQTDPGASGNSGAGGVETSEESRSNSGLPKWAYGHERQLREMKRTLAALNERLAQPDSRAPKGPEQNGNAPVDVFSDPDTWAEKKFESLQQKREIAKQKTEALKYLRSQKDVTPDNEDEVVEVLHEKGLMPLIETNPKFAMELAYKAWLEKRGITAADGQPDAAKLLAKDQARGVAGAAASGGQKVWSKAEIDRVANDPEQWEKHGNDIKAAIDAGRVRP